MKTSITLQEFQDKFRRMGRSENFSPDGLRVLYEHFREVEDEEGIELDLDVIEVCCEYAEFSSCREAVQQFYCMDCETEEEAEEALRAAHAVYKFDGGVVVSNW